jgi:hypothetical protein
VPVGLVADTILSFLVTGDDMCAVLSVVEVLGIVRGKLRIEREAVKVEG